MSLTSAPPIIMHSYSKEHKMENAIAGTNVVLYLLFGGIALILTIVGMGFTVIGAMFYLFKTGLDEKFEGITKESDHDREESKSDDKEVKSTVAKVDALRVEQITALHNRVGHSEKENCKLDSRLSYMEGLHAEHKPVGRTK